MNTVHIALVSSTREFDEERGELQRRIKRLRELLTKRKIEVQFEVWPDSEYGPEAQKKFDERIRQSDFCFGIIGREVGEHTRRELGVAHEQFKKSGNVGRPLITVFFRDLKPGEELTPEEIRAGRIPPEDLKPWAVEMGRYVPFSNFEELYDKVVMELVMHGVAFPEGKTRLSAEWKIRENRRKIRKLSAKDDEAELSILHKESVTLSEAWNIAWDTFYEYAAFLHKRGYHAKAAEVGARLDKRYDEDGGKPDERAALKCLLGDCQMSQGEHEAAEPYYRDALALYRELAERKAKYRADAAELCAKLAEIMRMTFRYEAAERLYREALAHYLDDAERYAAQIGRLCRAMQPLMGPQRQEQAAILHRAEQTATYCAVKGVGGRMGDVRGNLRHWLEMYPRPDSVTPRMRDAEAQALELTKDKPEDYERALAEICYDTAKWLWEHNQMEVAEAFARRALEIRRSLAEKDPDTFELNVAASLNTLAQITRHTNRPRESEQCYQEAIDITRRLTSQDPHTLEGELAKLYHNLGVLFWETKRYEGSERNYREALGIFRELVKQGFGLFKPYLAGTRNSLGLLLYDKKRYAEAERYYREALEIRRRFSEQNPDIFKPDLAKSCLNLANLLGDTQRYQEAERYYREALEIFRKLVKQDPDAFEPYLARACYNYGHDLLYDWHDPETAKAYFDEAIALWEKYPPYQKLLDDAISGRSDCQRTIYELQYGRGS